MIPRITKSLQTPDWQTEMSRAVYSPKALIEALDLPKHLLTEVEKAHALFPLKVPPVYLGLIKKGDMSDPLLRQILPIGAELDENREYSLDPVGDGLANPAQGILHKYHGRVLLVLTGACAIHCRYCFRRHFDYRANNPTGSQWQQTIEYIQRDNSIREVILSGGDPLSLSDGKLGQLIEELEDISHLRYLRLHTRLLIGIPSRMTEALIKRLASSRLRVSLVTHINHPQEIGTDLKEALLGLGNTPITVLNQSVLLRGVNDDVTTLETLSHSLFEAGVIPYYLHMLDRVKGANHFDIPEDSARMLYRGLQSRLPGYLLPRLVREIPGEPSKTPLLM